jgi:hypothetical protein
VAEYWPGLLGSHPQPSRHAQTTIMAELNGFSMHEDTVSVSHLGKRKRTASPETKKTQNADVKPISRDVLHLLHKCVSWVN